MKSITTVHFTVDPDGITRLIREMWAEGNYEKALNVLGAMKHGTPLPTETQFEIIRGNKKFANYKGDPDQFCIKPDKWKPKDFRYYPDPSPDKLAAFLAEKARQESKREDAKIRRGYVFQSDDDDDLPTSPSLPMKRFGGYDSLEEMNLAFAFKRSVQTPEELIQTMHSRDEREAKGKPKPDKTLSADMAWIKPDGKFYACLTKMEHIWLAGQFGLTERQAEEAGWVKITRDFTGQQFIHKGRIEPTQKQINTVFDWCQKHGAKLPDWAGGSDE